MKILHFLIIASFLIGIGTPAIGAQETDQLPYPGTLPDSPFYGMKLFFERMGTAFTFGDEAKIQRNIELAERRLSEAIAMTKKGKPIDSIMTEYNARITEANRLGNLTYGEIREHALERMVNATARHIAIMEQVKQRVPEQARYGIEHAINVSTIRNHQVLETLEEEHPGQSYNLILNLTEERANRLVNTTQYYSPANWSEMRDMLVANIDRQIDILENLKERAKTEESRQGIQRAIERLEKWKEKLLTMEIPPPIPSITHTPITIPIIVRPSRPTSSLTNTLAIGAIWNAESPTVVTIKVTASSVPVEGINIKIDDIDAGITDSSGELSHTFPILGSYNIHASKFGYNDTTVTLTLMQSGVSISTSVHSYQ